MVANSLQNRVICPSNTKKQMSGFNIAWHYLRTGKYHFGNSYVLHWFFKLWTINSIFKRKADLV